MKITRRSAPVVVSLAVGLGALAPGAGAVQQPAAPPAPRAMVSAVPAAYTPPVADGDVRAIAKVGSTMVIGGSFTSVKGLARSRVAAFDAATGAMSRFNLAVDGEVSAIVPGPTPDTAYIGGAFTKVGATARRNVALVNLATNSVVPTFTAPGFGRVSRVNDMVKVGGRLVLGGNFTVVGGRTHRGIAALNASTGAVDHGFLDVQFAGRHNDSGSGAQGRIGPSALDVTPGGDRIVVIGNFKTADGLPRDQVAQLSVGATRAVVTPDWNTDRYRPYCFKNAFDDYVRGVSYSPDGSYFVISTTGGGVRDTLCDASARFETYAVGSDVQPTWVTETGGDTVWGTEITSNAVYVGGHQRWANNPFGSDFAGPGAVPRPGLVALDPASGRPLQWNPGRNPPGKAVYALLATAEGLWIGSNTDYIGNRAYLRRKIALFPYAGGQPLAETTVGTLPGSVFRGGSVGGSASDQLYRVGLTTTGVSAAPAPAPGGGVPWSQTRGAFMVGNKVFYALATDGFLYSRTFTGDTWGPAVKINPYHDPAWATVSDNLGGTFNGRLPTLYGQIPDLTSMFYADGRLYYTLARSGQLRWRWFSPDSGIVDERTFVASSSVNLRDARGAFVTGGYFYYASTVDGSLYRVGWTNGAAVGAPVRISGPSLDGVRWGDRSLFLLKR